MKIPNEIALFLLLFPVLLIVSFWYVVIPLLLGLIGYGLFVHWTSFRPWNTYEPSLSIASDKYLRADGVIDKGSFTLIEQSTSHLQPYPKMVTLTITDGKGNVKWSVTRSIDRRDLDGAVTIGTYRGNEVAIYSGAYVGANPSDCRPTYCRR